MELYRAQFLYRRDNLFNSVSYLTFLQQIARGYRRQGAVLIHDNASYHKDAERYGRGLQTTVIGAEVHQLPSYCPELNPTERLWQHTRKNGTHNRYFADEQELLGTLSRVFADMQAHPDTIRPYLQSFCCS